MYVVNSTKWDAARLSGQEKLVVDAWLEAVADDCDPACWPPIFSTFQLVKNLLTILEEVSLGTLKPYQVTHACEEILARFDEGTWLEEQFVFDVPFLKEKLRWVRERTKDTADDIRARSEMASFLKAFVQKVEANRPWQQQIQVISVKAADATTRFQVLVRAVGELTNELMHTGHSRAHLNRWVLRQVVGAPGPQPYLDSIRAASYLCTETRRPFEVMFQVASPAGVTDSDLIRFFSAMPSGWALDPSSIFLKDTRSRFVIVRIASAGDGYAAVVHARSELSRYLWSMRFHHLEFDRAISKHAAVREEGQAFVQEETEPRHLDHRALWNHKRLDAIPDASRDKHTHAALQRILYWIEQARRVEPVAALISEWTALEFFFSVPGLSDLDAVERYVPAYLAINFPRWLVLDFWKFLQHIRPTRPADLETRLSIRYKPKPHVRPTCNLARLLEACLEDDATNRIKPLISDYPLLLAKWHRLRRLRPGEKSVLEDVHVFAQRLKFDVRTCYRARNTVVHDAAMSVSENERLLQRLNWMLCGCVDQVLYQFFRNVSLGLVDIHRCNFARWDKWREIVADTATVCSVETLVYPPVYFMK